MLRVIKDCILQGESVREGETFCETDFSPAAIQIIVGAGCAEFVYDAKDDVEDGIAEDPEDFAVEPVKATPKKAAKRKATKKK